MKHRILNCNINGHGLLLTVKKETQTFIINNKLTRMCITIRKEVKNIPG